MKASGVRRARLRPGCAPLLFVVYCDISPAPRLRSTKFGRPPRHDRKSHPVNAGTTSACRILTSSRRSNTGPIDREKKRDPFFFFFFFFFFPKNFDLSRKPKKKRRSPQPVAGEATVITVGPCSICKQAPAVASIVRPTHHVVARSGDGGKTKIGILFGGALARRVSSP